MSFGAQLLALRQRKHLKQIELAALVQVSRSTIANLEANRQAPSWELASLLADVLEVSLDDFRCPVTAGGAPHA